MLAEHKGSAVLYNDLHLDPELNIAGKGGVLTELSDIIRKGGPHFVVAVGDFTFRT